MTPGQWKEFAPYFSAQECGEGMDYSFMLLVLKLRERLGAPMIVHAGYASHGHAGKSLHYEGRALDFHVPNVSPRRVLQVIDELGCFNGVGWYPFWNNPGFHIDNRPAESYQRWRSPKEGIYNYLL